MKVELENVKPMEIEKRSFEIITEELGDTPLIPGTELIVKRCIHTSADFDYAKNLCFSEGAVEMAMDAIRNGACIVTDTQMAKAGINKRALARYGGEAYCFMSDEDVAALAKKNGTTRATASMDKAAEMDKKLIFAIGNAPTALVRLYELIEEGKAVVQETRRWDDNKEYSYAMRSKEDAKDYRYFPDPDLPPVHISDEWIDRIVKSMPEFQPEKQARYVEQYGLPQYDAGILTGSKKLSDLFEETTALCGKPKKVANWLMGETLRLLKENGQEPEDLQFSPKHLASLIELAEAGSVNNQVAKEVFEQIFAEDVDPEAYVEEHGLKTVNDTGLLEETARKVLENNPGPVEQYKSGKTKVLGFLVGQVMKEMKGKANPAAAGELLQKLLSE